MEILKQSRPSRSSVYVYTVYMQLPHNGDLVRVSAFRNYWRALDEYNRCVAFDGKQTKYVLVGNECDPYANTL